MKLALALLLNLLLLAGLAGWLRTEYRRSPRGLRRWLLPALALRLAASLGQDGPDARLMLAWGRALTAQFWARPAASWALWQGHQLRIDGQMCEVYEWSNTLLVSKLLGLLNLASLGSQWLNGCYIGVLSFAGCWLLVRSLVRLFPAAPVGAAVVAFLLWPSVVWWTSGITKEALVLGSGAALMALGLARIYGPAPPLRTWQRLGSWLLLLGLAWVHLRLRYFFALPLLGSLLALAGVERVLQRSGRRVGWGGLLVTLLGGLAAAGTLAVALGGEPVSREFVTSQLWQNYQHGVATSPGRPHLSYPGLQPTVASMAQHFPLAAAETLVRPWLGESWLVPYVAAGFENLLLLGLLVAAVVRGRAGRLPPALVLALLLYCLVLVGLIGLSTPNLGTLHRYRAVMLPWLVWLLLQPDYIWRKTRKQK